MTCSVRGDQTLSDWYGDAQVSACNVGMLLDEPVSN